MYCMRNYDENLEKILTAIFGVIGSLAIILNLFIKGYNTENLLDSLKDLAGLLVTIVVFLVAMKAVKRLSYSNFKQTFDQYLHDWVLQNRFLIDEVKRKEGKENKEFYYMLTKAHHKNVVLQEKLAADFNVNDGSIYHKGAFIYTDYKESEEFTIGLNKSFFIEGRGGEFPAPFANLTDIAEIFKKRIIENYENMFDYIDAKDRGIPIAISENGTRLKISIKKIANTKHNAKIAINMIEYIKTLIITLA